MTNEERKEKKNRIKELEAQRAGLKEEAEKLRKELYEEQKQKELEEMEKLVGKAYKRAICRPGEAAGHIRYLKVLVGQGEQKGCSWAGYALCVCLLREDSSVSIKKTTLGLNRERQLSLMGGGPRFMDDFKEIPEKEWEKAVSLWKDDLEIG